MKLLIEILPEHLDDWDACYEGDELEQAKACLPATPLEIAAMEQFPVRDRVWLLLRREIIPERKLHELGCVFAEDVLHLFEKQFPDDKRPRQAIEAKRKWLRGEITDRELAAARDDARDVWHAAFRALDWDAPAARAAAWAARAAWAAGAAGAAGAAEAAWDVWFAKNPRTAVEDAVRTAQLGKIVGVLHAV